MKIKELPRLGSGQLCFPLLQRLLLGDHLLLGNLKLPGHLLELLLLHPQLLVLHDQLRLRRLEVLRQSVHLGCQT